MTWLENELFSIISWRIVKLSLQFYSRILQYTKILVYIPSEKSFAIQFCFFLQNEIPKFYFNCSWTQEGGFFLLPLLGKKGSCKILFLTSGLVFLVHSQWISSSLFRGHTHFLQGRHFRKKSIYSSGSLWTSKQS